ncbi:hypothetical protein CVT24_003581 [Panaeolus cyanescens]|uniref:F-box domain-containing protein n=1 Tax=Panaeolus cyanescens TaxID=181874 RepID=A0A409Y7L3_9AGAR|nr:hypothetical protein CVT24_003581 [Panaeolus cyanescens]
MTQNLGVFQSLTTLTITYLCCPPSLARLFASIGFPGVATFRICLSEQFMIDRGIDLVWDKLFSIIAGQFPNLRTFKTEVVAKSSQKDEKWGVPWSRFQSLLTLSDLVCLSINGPYVHTLENADVDTMIASWPKLETFVLTVWGYCEMDHTALLAISKGLPNLVKLEIPVDLSSVPKEVMHLNHSVHELSSSTVEKLTMLKHLVIGHVLRPMRIRVDGLHIPVLPFSLPPADDAQMLHRLARLLDGLFPRLNEVKLRSNVTENRRKAYGVLIEFFGCMRVTRNVEREILWASLDRANTTMSMDNSSISMLL